MQSHRSVSRHSSRTLPVVYSFILVVLLLGGCSRSLNFTSKWVSQPLDIRLKSGEIQNALTRIEETQTMVAFLNDSNYLYISLVTSDRSIQRQLIARGFIIWFDREGNDEQRFGIKFPLGMMGSGGFRDMRERMRDERDSEGESRERFSRDSLIDRLPPLDTTEIEILGNGGEKHERLKVMELKQIAVSITIENGRLQYTMRVPLTDNGPQPYAIGTTPGATISVGLVTPEFERPRMNEEGGMPGGAGRRGRGGFGGGGGGMPPEGGRMFQQSEPFNIWARVTLANGAGK